MYVRRTLPLKNMFFDSWRVIFFIEIDMKQFLNEKEIPEPLKVLKGIAY